MPASTPAARWVDIPQCIPPPRSPRLSVWASRAQAPYRLQLRLLRRAATATIAIACAAMISGSIADASSISAMLAISVREIISYAMRTAIIATGCARARMITTTTTTSIRKVDDLRMRWPTAASCSRLLHLSALLCGRLCALQRARLPLPFLPQLFLLSASLPRSGPRLPWQV